jgi:integrase
MSIELRTGRNGKLRPTWYGRYEIDGRRYTLNLGVKVRGTPPKDLSLREEGDAAFERSRAKAKERLDNVIEEARRKYDSAHLVERIYEIKTGERIKSVALHKLPEEWARIPRRRKPNEQYAAQCQAILTRFVAFIQAKNPKARELAHVTRSLARSFLESEAERKVTAKTWNDTLKLLRSTCKHLLPPGSINPFSDVPTRESETVFRKPFTPAELQKIVDASREDEFIRPIIITGICTAMRRGDCCLLKWKDVDLKQRFITVKTNKTGQTVSIPIFPMLYDELAGRKQTADYVFPEQAAMYRENADGITWRVQKVLTKAFMTDKDAKALPKLSEKETRQRVQEYIAALPATEKTTRMKQVFEMYMDDKPSKEIMTAPGVSKGSVAHYLNQIEAGVRCRIVLGRPDKATTTARIRTDKDILHAQREGGTRRASTRDFHSFRVTWVTIALTAGVPLELVQKVTGHRTTDIVLKHYFQPGREDFRKTIQAAMPRMLVETTKPYAVNATPEGCLRMALADLDTMTARDWKAKRDSASSLIRYAQQWYDDHILREKTHPQRQ